MSTTELAKTSLAAIQVALRAPKGQINTFGDYRYRSCEDILEAVKPLLKGMALTLSDEMVEVGGRVYVKATATFEGISVTAFAREQEMKKGMDQAQITGAASSYARKYALNGLFLIDDTKDADTTDNRGAGKQVLTPAIASRWQGAKDAFKRDGNLSRVLAVVDMSPEHQAQLQAEVRAEQGNTAPEPEHA
ncbi:ERF family protein [Porticoccus sp.]